MITECKVEFPLVGLIKEFLSLFLSFFLKPTIPESPVSPRTGKVGANLWTPKKQRAAVLCLESAVLHCLNVWMFESESCEQIKFPRSLHILNLLTTDPSPLPAEPAKILILKAFWKSTKHTKVDLISTILVLEMVEIEWILVHISLQLTF